MPALPLSESDLPVRAFTRLRAAGVLDLAELTAWTRADLMKIEGIGAGTVLAISSLLVEHDLALAEGRTGLAVSGKKFARKLTFEQRAELIRLYQQGWSTGELARHFGISRYAAYIRVRAENPDGTRSAAVAQKLRHAKTPVPPLPPEQVAICLPRDYLTAPDAAEDLGISRFTMLEYLEAGKFPGAFQMGTSRRFWLVPRASVEARKAKRNV